MERLIDLRIVLLGGFAARLDEQLVPEPAWRLRKAKSLVKLLALAPGHRLHREQLIETLWPEFAPAAGANNLHQALRAARQAFAQAGGHDCLDLKEDIVALVPSGGVWTDVEAFEAASRQARQEHTPASYDAALALFAGELLPDDPYEDWAEQRREEIGQDARSLLFELGELQMAAGAFEKAFEPLRRLVTLEPTHEPAHRALMRLYAYTGQRRLALRQFETLRATLQRELETAPEPDSDRLYRDVLSGQLERPGNNNASALLDVATREAATDTSGSAPRGGARVSSPHNLPRPLSRFVGRQREMTAVRGLLTTNRLVTLTGTGGCGKTRLAIEVAAGSLSSFRNGVWLVELAALSEPDLIGSVIAQSLGVREQPGRTIIEVLSEYLRTRHALILIDNCEHLVDASGRLAETLLQTCPTVTILATSRQPLRISGEAVWRVPSLSLPNPALPVTEEDLEHYEATSLFIDRATAVAPEFSCTLSNAASIARICYRLDGLPLAIELAAARVPTLSLETIARRLDDRFALLTTGSRTALTRQQTLKAAIDWSHDVLDLGEQALLRRLSTFAGAFGLAAAEAICAEPSTAKSEVLPLLAELVDKSLVAADPAAGDIRYRLLESIREYARARLHEAGELDRVLQRHADWFLNLAERADAGFSGSNRVRWLNCLEADHDNLRAAFEWLLGRQPLEALRLAGTLWQFWIWRGYLREGQRALEAALAMAPDASPARSKALLGASALTVRTGNLTAGAALAADSLAVSRERDDMVGSGRALVALAAIAWLRSEYARAEAFLEEGLALAKATRNKPGYLAAIHSLSAVHWSTGALDASEARLMESLELAQALASEPASTVPLFTVAGVDWVSGEPGKLRIVFQETFFPVHEVSTHAAAAYILANLGNLARWRRDYAAARAYLEQSLVLAERGGDAWGKGQVLARLGNLAVAERRYPEAEVLLRKSLTIRRGIGDTRGVGLTLMNLGDLAGRSGADVNARELLEEAIALFRETGDLPGLCNGLGVRARWAAGRGEYDLARASIDEILSEVREIPDRYRHAWVLLDLADLEALTGDGRRAEAALVEAERLFRQIGHAPGIAQSGLGRLSGN